MPIRLRITLLTAGIMLFSLLGLSAGVYYTMSRNMRSEMDTRLQNVYVSYRRTPGTITLGPRGYQFEAQTDPFASSGVYIQVMSPDGAQATGSQNLGATRIPVPAEVMDANNRSQDTYYATEVNGQPIRVYSAPIQIGNPDPKVFVLVQVAERLAPLNQTLDNLRKVLVGGSVLATLALAAGAWLVAGASLSPLARMSGAAAKIGRGGDLSTRIDPPSTHDEVQQLAETFNEMLARLESNFGAQRRFVADASHELRTPLTALRANADIMLRQVDGGAAAHADLVEGLTDVRNEVDRMTRLVHNLLILARADVGWRPELGTVDLALVARDVARIAAPLRRGQHLNLQLGTNDGQDPELLVTGNADQLTQLLLILLDNAFTYTPPGTRVALTLRRVGDMAEVSVQDDGPGIPRDHLDRIFERFYRADEARTRSVGGTGLGLSIARWIVTVHNGTIDVDSEAGAGATFTVQLPLVPTTSTPAVLAREPEMVAAPLV